MPQQNQTVTGALIAVALPFVAGTFFTYWMVVDYFLRGGEGYDRASGMAAGMVLAICAPIASILMLIAARYSPVANRWPTRILVAIWLVPLIGILIYFVASVALPSFAWRLTSRSTEQPTRIAANVHHEGWCSDFQSWLALTGLSVILSLDSLPFVAGPCFGPIDLWAWRSAFLQQPRALMIPVPMRPGPAMHIGFPDQLPTCQRLADSRGVSDCQVIHFPSPTRRSSECRPAR